MFPKRNVRKCLLVNVSLGELGRSYNFLKRFTMADPLNLTVSYGFNQPLVTGAPKPIISDRIPTSNDRAVLGTIWVYKPGNVAYIATSVSNNITVWTIAAASGGAFTSLVVDPGNIVVTSGNITANVGNITAGGTLTAGGNIQTLLGSINVLGSGDITVANGDVTLANGNIEVANTANSVSSAELNFFKSRNNGIISSGDQLGSVSFLGYEGSDFKVASQIIATSSGTIGVDQVASNLEFYTSPDAVSVNPIQRMVINSTGKVSIQAPDVGSGDPALEVLADIDCAADIFGSAVRVSGDNGGAAAHVSFSGISDLTANGAGDFTIKSKSANNLDSSGFIKIYIDNTPYYIPVFSSPAP